MHQNYVVQNIFILQYILRSFQKKHPILKMLAPLTCSISGPTPPPPSATSTCSTTSGPEPDSECKFPFIFQGIVWTGCTTVDGDPNPWCVTQTDESGHPVSNADGTFTTWGYCHESCPFDQGLAFFYLMSLYLSDDMALQIL